MNKQFRGAEIDDMMKYKIFHLFVVVQMNSFFDHKRTLETANMNICFSFAHKGFFCEHYRNMMIFLFEFVDHILAALIAPTNQSYSYQSYHLFSLDFDSKFSDKFKFNF